VSTHPAALTVASAPGRAGDWRVERMCSLIEDPWLPGEWDPTRLLLTPRPEGLLSRRRACLAPDCSADRDGARPLCRGHAAQFARSGAGSVEEWIAGDGPGPLRRRLSDECCAVRDEDDGGCPRPARGLWGLCMAHAESWSNQQQRGSGFEAFLAQARSLSSFGDCTAACCYRLAGHGLGLCECHYRMWIADGSPRGEALERWRRRVRQPASRQVLSLRGLPELVGRRSSTPSSAGWPNRCARRRRT